MPIELDSGWQEDELSEVNLPRAEDAIYSARTPIAEDTIADAEGAGLSSSTLPSIAEADSLPEVSVPFELSWAAIAPPEIPVENSPPLPAVPETAANQELQPLEEEFTDVQLTEAIAIPAAAERQPLRLILAQETWVMQRNQPLTLTGAIAPLEASTDSTPIQGQLHIRLFDPQNSQTVLDQYYPVQDNQPLPVSFACELSLPVSPTYLLLGELVLYGLAQPGALPPVLASQSFNVTTELHELLEAIANNFPSPDLVLPPQAPVPKAAQPAIDLSFFNIPPVAQTLLKFQPSEQNFLPPQLHPANPENCPEHHPVNHPENYPAKVHRLDLPSFSVSDAEPESFAAAKPQETAQPQDPIVLEDPIVLDSAVITDIVAHIASATNPSATNPSATNPSATKTDATTLENSCSATTSTEIPLAQDMAIAPAAKAPPSPERVDELIGDWDEDWEIAADGTLNWRQVQPHKPASPEDRAFQSLNLQNRFLNRLQTLATDPEISDWLREPAAIVRANPIDQEIVVEDDEPPLPQPEPRVSFFSTDEPVPVPQIEVPSGELIAGQPSISP
ncbi:MAG: hypothetical protein HC781_17315 [Leptolyngbyaceae cyanobacterium CSU_1_4]|nr:hypothetical protein [Leptolyngbyaceae cyanobacterium CSU_1_4]